jgi:hypothetical protein
MASLLKLPDPPLAASFTEWTAAKGPARTGVGRASATKAFLPLAQGLRRLPFILSECKVLRS